MRVIMFGYSGLHGARSSGPGSDMTSMPLLVGKLLVKWMSSALKLSCCRRRHVGRHSVRARCRTSCPYPVVRQASSGSTRWRFGRLCCLVRLSAEIFWTLACRNRASGNSQIAAVTPKLLSLHLITWLTPLSNADRAEGGMGLVKPRLSVQSLSFNANFRGSANSPFWRHG